MVGQVISGEFGNVVIRQKSGHKIELGELLVADSPSGIIIMQVFNLIYGSQHSQTNLELMSGMQMEHDTDLEMTDSHLRNYTLAVLKNLITVKDNRANLSKTLPGFFSHVREITQNDLSFLIKPDKPLFIGKLRSGTKLIDVDLMLDGEKVLSHHILVAATTGRGKSNLVKNICWNLIPHDYSGVLVIDPHDEYYGRNSVGLKDHPLKKKVVYYTPKNVPPGCRTLVINVSLLRPQHFEGVMDWSDAQKEALDAYYKQYSNEWIDAILMEKPLNVRVNEATLAVVKRRMLSILDIRISNMKPLCRGIFTYDSGSTILSDIVNELESAKVVIVDTSTLPSSGELLVGSMLCHEIITRYRNYKATGELREKPVISVVLEEAPRVLSREALENGPNIFSTIAREGRKFKIGLTAITQLPSLIPRDILANMNTKIILGLEMGPERRAIIESASQDLSDDERTIAALDVGEALITSNFTKFATPVKIPLFEESVREKKSPAD